MNLSGLTDPQLILAYYQVYARERFSPVPPILNVAVPMPLVVLTREALESRALAEGAHHVIQVDFSNQVIRRHHGGAPLAEDLARVAAPIRATMRRRMRGLEERAFFGHTAVDLTEHAIREQARLLQRSLKAAVAAAPRHAEVLAPPSSAVPMYRPR